MRSSPQLDDSLPTLVDLTYSATTDPGRYDELVQVWERYMSQLEPGEIEDSEHHHLRHFNRALEIFERIGRQKHREDRADALVGLFDAPACVIDRAGVVQQSNASQDQMAFALTGPGQGTPAAPDPEDLRRAVRDIQQGANVALVPVQDAAGTLVDCLVVTGLEELRGEGDRFLVVSSGPQVSAAQMDQMAAQFGLSQSEREVMQALMAGEKVSQISARRGVGEATTRTQVRQLLDKTGSATLADLIRQATQISAQMTAVGIAQKIAGPGNAPEPARYDRILTSDGRLLAYRDFGDPNGRPVLFIHNMMGGAIWPRDMEQTARARGWRIIAPSRPGFGLSDQHTVRDMALVRATCQDMRALLDHLMVDRVLVVGMMSSAGLGIRFTKDHADRVVGLLNVGHAGLMDDQLIDAMANPSRGMAKTYRRSPTALRFLIRVAVASVDLLGPVQMLRSNFRRSGPDAVLLQNEALVGAIGDGLRHAVAQGGEAFSRDGFVALHDFSDDVAGLTRRAVCLLGAEDPMYPVPEARRIMADLPNYDLEVFDGAGQYVFYGKFPETSDLMQKIWNDGLGVGLLD